MSRAQLHFPWMPELQPLGRPRVYRMRLTDAGDCYRAWRCRLCGHVAELHYDREPPVRYAEPCPVCNDPEAPAPRCSDCAEPLPRRGIKRCLACARKARAAVFRARWLAAHPPDQTDPLFPALPPPARPKAPCPKCNRLVAWRSPRGGELRPYPHTCKPGGSRV